MSRVEVVLFVKGKGSDAASFRPRRDETQWWNRRDAIVRCVAAFLCGPCSQKCKQTLVLLFDEDWARMQVELAQGYDDPNFVPTEQHVIGLLQQAAEAPPGTLVQTQGLQATLILSSHMPPDSANLPSSLDSKRSILEYMQKTCDMEFLRQHGLNSSTAHMHQWRAKREARYP